MSGLFRSFLFASHRIAPACARDISLAARDTISGFLLEPGDTLRFKLRNGQSRALQLDATDARILLTNLREIKKPQPNGGTVYEMAVRVRIDGHPLRIGRYRSTQESYAGPVVVNGIRFWLDATSDMMNVLTDDHGGCELPLDRRPASLAPPCASCTSNIGESYNGDDPHLGAYQGAACHAGRRLLIRKFTRSASPDGRGVDAP